MSIDTSTQLGLVDQYADVLDLNWRRRSHLLRSHVVGFSALVNWDDRIRTSMAALKELGSCVRGPLRSRLNDPLLAGELFSIGLYGFLANDTELLQACDAIAQTLPHLQPAWCAAMQWAPSSNCLQQTIARLPVDQQMQVLGLRRGEVADTAQQIQHLFEHANKAPMNVQTIRAALTLIRAMADDTRTNAASHFLSHQHAGVRLDAARVLLAMGSSKDQRRNSFDVLLSLVDADDAILRESAVQSLALHWDDTEAVRSGVTAALQRVANRCNQIDERDELARLYLRMLGWLGSIDGIQVLMHHLNGPHRRTAAVSLSLITGSEPVRDGWQGQPTEAQHPTKDAGDDLIPSIHPENGMLWPNASEFERWWAQNANRFDTKLRYFAGHPLSAALLEQTLWDCPLAWRPWAAEHWQRLTHRALFPWDAPAWLQKRPKVLLKDNHHA